MQDYPNQDQDDRDSNEGTGLILWVFISFGILTGGVVLLLWMGC